MAGEGKQFEKDIKTSADEQGVFYYRIKDTFIPPELRLKVKVSKNDFDGFSFYKGHLFCLELKSTKQNSLSLAESVVKAHQIASLYRYSHFEGVVSGLLVNMREKENKTYILPIEKVMKYIKIGQGEIENVLDCKVNKGSITYEFMEKHGVEVKNAKKKTNYRYYIKMAFDELIKLEGIK